MNPALQSLRLDLRPCTAADVDLLLRHWTEPSVRRFLFDDRVVERETVAGFVAASSASFEKDGYGLWLLNGRADGEFRGVCGLCETVVKPDLLFSIAPPYWGRGLAAEAARRVLQYAFGELGLPGVIATVDKPNKLSVRTLEMLGMTLTEERLIDGKPILYYALAAGDYISIARAGSQTT